MKYYSQINQDKNVLEYFNQKKDGFFIEIGANDGITLSNTKALEELGWEGICIEANKDSFDRCKNNRICKCVNVAVWNKQDEVTFSTPADSLVGGIKKTFQTGHILKWGKMNPFYETKVKTDTLLNILDQCKAPLHIDYLSLDTEGSEADILEHFFTYNKFYHIQYIDVEHNFNSTAQVRLTKLIEDNGYTILRQNNWDWTLVKKDK